MLFCKRKPLGLHLEEETSNGRSESACGMQRTVALDAGTARGDDGDAASGDLGERGPIGECEAKGDEPGL